MVDRLGKIAERWRKATPGPWQAFELTVYESVPHGDWLEWAIAPKDVHDLDRDKLATVEERTQRVDGKVVFSTDIDQANAIAIAHAPEDIAFLLAEVKRLRGALADIADGPPYSVTHQSDHYYRDIARAAIDWRDNQEEEEA